MLDPIANLITLTLSVLFPVYASYKALIVSDQALLTPWLTYWLVLALVNSALSILSFILPYLPFYAWLRLGLHLYLLLPGEQQGATFIYRTYILPVLVDHDTQIEHFIATAHDRAKALGLEYWERLLEYVKTQIFGEGSKGTPQSSNIPAHATTVDPVVTGQSNKNYTQSLLSRFSLPSARPSPSAANNDVAAVLSSVLQATLGASAVANSATKLMPDTQAVQSLLQHLTVPPQLPNPTERLSYITAQTERLRTLLGIYDKHAQDLASSQELDPLTATAATTHAEVMPGTLADSQLLTEDTEAVAAADIGMRKSKSEADFESIEHIEAPIVVGVGKSETASKSAGGWNAWMWSRNGGAEAMKTVAGQDAKKVEACGVGEVAKASK